MKRTLTVNIGGVVFHIDDDAYEQLHQYLANIRSHFANDEGCEEILSDIENRVAETLQANLSEGKQVVTLGDVQRVISQLGEPEQIDNEADTGSATGAKSASPKGPRRLYRNPDGAILGGVAGGLAAFFQIDTTLVRLAFVLFAFVGGFSIITYLVMWIVVPRANTTAEKLEMKGVRVNISNIEKSIKEELEDVKKNVKKFSAEAERAIRNKTPGRSSGEVFLGGMATAFGEVVKVVFKVVAVLVGLFLLFTAIFLLIGFLWVLAGGPITIDQEYGMQAVNFNTLANLIFTNQTLSNISFVSMVLLAGIPLLAMLYAGTLLIVGSKARVRYFGRVALMLWLVGLGLGLFSIARGAKNYVHQRSVSEATSIQISANDTLYIDVDANRYNNIGVIPAEGSDLDSWELMWITNNGNRHHRPVVRIIETASENFEVIVNKRARGAQPQIARQNAGNILYGFRQEQNRIMLDPFFAFPEADGWRAQRVTVEILVPENMQLVLSHALKETFDVYHNRTREMSLTISQSADRHALVTVSGSE
ncbi:MAG TPA: PspC domain-containing protein [Bacteroidales bacterium]|nr:PspC domain-containing protein [Bacteroidales bacterium]